MSQQTVSEFMKDVSVVPVVQLDDQHQTEHLCNTLLEGGINSIEITLRSEYGKKAIETVAKAFPEMKLLAGTVINCEDMSRVIDLGAQVVVSPGVSASMLQMAESQSLQLLPGVANASQIMTCLEYGVVECKLFPASVAGGISALKAFAGPFAQVNFCPTGGVNVSNYNDYLAMDNVMFVGGTWLAPTKDIQDGNWDAILQRCKQITEH